MVADAWMEKCLIGISVINGEEVQFSSITETADFDIGEKDVEGTALVNGGRVTKFSVEGDSTITFEAYPLETGAGEGFFDLLHGNETVMSRTTTGTTASKLVDTSGDFINNGIRIGDRITNTTDTTYATVTAIDSATVLSVSADVFTSSENYTIFRGVRIVNGSASSTSAGKLVDATKVFTNRIAAGDKVRNTTDNTEAVVTAVDNATTLSITPDIMASGEDYILSESPQRVINNRIREKHRVVVLWTDKSATKASEAIANTYNALRIGYADGIFTSVKPSFTDGNLKFTVTYKCAAFDKSANSNVMMESCAAGGGSDALPVIADYTTSNKFG
jgi:hypothetical protein